MVGESTCSSALQAGSSTWTWAVVFERVVKSRRAFPPPMMLSLVMVSKRLSMFLRAFALPVCMEPSLRAVFMFRVTLGRCCWGLGTSAGQPIGIAGWEWALSSHFVSLALRGEGLVTFALSSQFAHPAGGGQGSPPQPWAGGSGVGRAGGGGNGSTSSSRVQFVTLVSARVLSSGLPWLLFGRSSKPWPSTPNPAALGGSALQSPTALEGLVRTLTPWPLVPDPTALGGPAL